jgi:hypothetical protein
MVQVCNLDFKWFKFATWTSNGSSLQLGPNNLALWYYCSHSALVMGNKPSFPE